jgi:hypothetical protein
VVATSPRGLSQIHLVSATKNEWVNHLRTSLPDLVDIGTVERPEDKHRYLVLKYQDGLEAPSWLVSDGTLRLLALTLLAYIPELSGVCLIEEPENGIHPRAVETVFEALSQVHGAQILCASHSPLLVSRVSLDNLLCFARSEEAATAIIRGRDHPRLKEWSGVEWRGGYRYLLCQRGAGMSETPDLIVLCADKKIEATIQGLIDRPRALRIRPISYKILVHPQRDPGCYHQAAAFLKPMRSSFAHALVVFDQSWEGAPSIRAVDLASKVEEELKKDWGEDAGVVVIDPKLEAWVWSDSPHVEERLGWKNKKTALRTWLTDNGYWNSDDPKPVDPKTAVERTIRETRSRWTAAVCKALATNVSVGRCTDKAFLHLKDLLSRWFARGGV